MKILDLVLKGKWYDMIASGEKLEEYRDITPYWCSRILYYIYLPAKDYWSEILFNLHTHEFSSERLIIDYGTRGYDKVRFHRGYTNITMLFDIDSISIGHGKEKWGAEKGKEYFVIKLKGGRNETIPDSKR